MRFLATGSFMNPCASPGRGEIGFLWPLERKKRKNLLWSPERRGEKKELKSGGRWRRWFIS
jgi:hypothetical protein